MEKIMATQRPLPAERLPRIPPEKMTGAQKKVTAEIAAGPRGERRGPINALLRSPDLTSQVQKVGEYLRFRSPLERRVAEMATLIAARHWTQQYEWNSHYTHAMISGL
jgi:4-carboxymuconolactone decarboxylase